MSNRFEQETIESILQGASNMFWCPSGCGSGQIHAMGGEQPIVVCQNCGGLFCHRHQVSWHTEHTCEEYDESIRDPNFRSQAQIQQDGVKVLVDQSTKLARQIAMADEEWRMSLLKRGDEARRRQIEKERIERERLEKEAALKAETIRLEQQAEAKRKADRQAEEQLGDAAVANIGQRCPACHRRIQRTYGW